MFDKEFDESLWFILETDAENRKEIIEFLKEIPRKLMISIRGVLSFKNSEVFEEDSFAEYIETENGTVYTCEINFDEEEKSLVIKKEFPTSKEATDSINFSVELLLRSEYFSSFMEDEIWVGDFTKICKIETQNKKNSQLMKKNFSPVLIFEKDAMKFDSYIQEQEFEYNLVKEDTGYYIRKSKLGGDSIPIPVDLTQMPDELSMDYINQRYRDNPKTKKMNPTKV